MTPQHDKPGGYVYLASPYTHPSPAVREYRYLKAAHACAVLFKGGIVPYSPIVHWHEISKIFDMPKDHNFWIMADSIMLTGAREFIVLMLDGWEQSAGVQRELKFSKLLSKPISYIEDQLDLR